MQDVRSNLEDIVRTKAEELPIEGAMMESTECKPVTHDWLPFRVGIRDNVRRVKQLFMTQAAEGALPLIGLEHPLAESPLVHADPNGCGDVGPACSIKVFEHGVRFCGRPCRDKQMLRIVDCNRHGQVRRVVSDDVYGPRRQILARHDPVKVREGKPAPHRLPQSPVLWVVRIGPAIPIP